MHSYAELSLTLSMRHWKQNYIWQYLHIKTHLKPYRAGGGDDEIEDDGQLNILISFGASSLVRKFAKKLFFSLFIFNFKVESVQT